MFKDLLFIFSRNEIDALIDFEKEIFKLAELRFLLARDAIQRIPGHRYAPTASDEGVRAGPRPFFSSTISTETSAGLTPLMRDA